MVNPRTGYGVYTPPCWCQCKYTHCVEGDHLTAVSSHCGWRAPANGSRIPCGPARQCQAVAAGFIGTRESIPEGIRRCCMHGFLRQRFLCGWRDTGAQSAPEAAHSLKARRELLSRRGDRVLGMGAASQSP